MTLLISQRVVSSFSRPSSLPSAYRPRRYPQSHRVPLARFLASLSLNERLVCEPLSRRAMYEAIEPRQGMVLDVAFIQPEREFINVAVEMLRAGVMIDADQAALQDGENAFDPVRGHAPAHVLSRAVIDGIVNKARPADARVRAAFVSMQSRPGLDMPVNGGLDRFLVRRRDWHGDCSPAALTHAKHSRLADRAATSLEPLGFVFVLFEAAHIGFIDFDDALQLFELRSARFAQPVKNEPSRLLGDPDFLGELHGRNALTRGHKLVHRVNPLVQRNVRPLENRSGSHGEVLVALIAAIKPFFARRHALAKSTNRAARPIRPKATFKIDPRRLLVGEHLEKLESGNRALGHSATPWPRSENGINFSGSQVYNSLKCPQWPSPPRAAQFPWPSRHRARGARAHG